MRRILEFILIIVLICLINTPPTQAVLLETDIEPLETRTAGRPLGMGGAFVGIADDGNAVFFNPAGLSRASGIALTIKDLNNLAVGEAYPTPYGTIGLGITATSVSQIPFQSGTIAYYSNIVSVGYGSDLWFSPALSWGIGVKAILSQGLTPSGTQGKQASGWDMDVGLMYRPWKWLQVGLCQQNALGAGSWGGGEMNWDGEKENIPFKTLLGVGLKVLDEKLLVGGDLEISSEQIKPSRGHVGFEWEFRSGIALRGGIHQAIKQGSVVSYLTGGLGFTYRGWGLDVAYHP